MQDENRGKNGDEGSAKKEQTIRQIAKDFIRNEHNKSRKCTGISDRQRKARIIGGKSQTGKRKAIITRGESQTGRKRQEEQSDRQNEKLLSQVEEVKQMRESDRQKKKRRARRTVRQAE